MSELFVETKDTFKIVTIVAKILELQLDTLKEFCYSELYLQQYEK